MGIWTSAQVLPTSGQAPPLLSKTHTHTHLEASAPPGLLEELFIVPMASGVASFYRLNDSNRQNFIQQLSQCHREKVPLKPSVTCLTVSAARLYNCRW